MRTAQSLVKERCCTNTRSPKTLRLLQRAEANRQSDRCHTDTSADTQRNPVAVCAVALQISDRVRVRICSGDDANDILLSFSKYDKDGLCN